MASLTEPDLPPPQPTTTEVPAATMSTSEGEVLGWLQSVGFQRYLKEFTEAGCFSLEVVVEIEKEDLQAMGIPSLPARALN